MGCIYFIFYVFCLHFKLLIILFTFHPGYEIKKSRFETVSASCELVKKIGKNG